MTDAHAWTNGLYREDEDLDVASDREAADALSALQSRMFHVARVNAVGTMATMLAHELNQPLTAIGNYAAGVMRTVDVTAPDYEQLAYALNGILEASQRAAEVIRNLRDLTRRRDSARTAFDLEAATGECIRLVRAAVSPDIAIVADIPAGLVMFADRVQIQQILINLLRNGCDAVLGAQHRSVTVSARREDRSLVVSVRDTGHGVPAAAAGNIFAWSQSAKDDGMGLGLSICRTIIESNHGRIWLENSSPHGSEFCFSVPWADQQVAR